MSQEILWLCHEALQVQFKNGTVKRENKGVNGGYYNMNQSKDLNDSLIR